MCGIAGYLTSEACFEPGEYGEIAARMAGTMQHRGPDDAGVWADPAAQIAMAQRRLSILDLSPAGRQPMVSASGRWVLVYNGEIYNHAEIRAELGSDRVSFRGTSDTESLLAAIDAWGVTASVRRVNGMFAFAAWDRQRRELTLARDRLGIKPLYYGRVGKALVFASELKALRCFPGFAGAVDRAALTLYLQHCYVPAPYSIYQGIGKLPPGCLVTLARSAEVSSAEPVAYWSMKETAQKGANEPFSGPAEEAIEQFGELLEDAVGARMLADVPLGAFLSGGYDSTTIVALMQSQSPRPVKTFSIGFEEKGYDEAPYARAVANQLGTDHCETYVTADEARDVVPRLPQMYDEPFADSSQIPTFLVSQMARRHVTVSLSGDGGDELFGGYERYRDLTRLWRRIRWLPTALRKATAPMLKACLPRRGGGVIARRLRTLSDFLTAPNARQLYARFFTHWKDPCRVVMQGVLPTTVFYDCENWVSRCDQIEQLMYVDSVTYLPDDILVKVDRASMAVSLETRVPFLDHRLVEFAWTLPVDFKLREGRSKWIVRELLDRYVPRPLVDRPKVGFGVPIDSWLRGPLRDWAEELLSDQRLAEDGFFDPRPIRDLWQQHLKGEQDWHYHLWDVLMFQAWREEKKDEG